MSMLSSLVMTNCEEIMPNDTQPTPRHVAVVTNQSLVYKHSRVIPRILILRIESVAKTAKLKPRINLGGYSEVYPLISE